MRFFDWLFGLLNKSEAESISPRVITDSSESRCAKTACNTETKKIDACVSDIFVFEAGNQDSRELSQCKVGDFVKFWYDSEPERIRIYRRGSVGGPGRIGDVPWEFYDIILNHLQQKFEFETELLDITTGSVKCRLVPKAETEANWLKLVNANAHRLSTEVTKKYTRKPKDGFEIRVTLPKDHALNEGDILYLEKQKLEHYIQNAKPFNMNLVNEKGEIVGSYGSFFDLCIRMLRASYNGYTVRIKLTSVRKPDIYEIKYIESVYAMAVVTFEPVA